MSSLQCALCQSPIPPQLNHGRSEGIPLSRCIGAGIEEPSWSEHGGRLQQTLGAARSNLYQRSNTNNRLWRWRVMLLNHHHPSLTINKYQWLSLTMSHIVTSSHYIWARLLRVLRSRNWSNGTRPIRVLRPMTNLPWAFLPKVSTSMHHGIIMSESKVVITGVFFHVFPHRKSHFLGPVMLLYEWNTHMTVHGIRQCQAIDIGRQVVSWLQRPIGNHPCIRCPLVVLRWWFIDCHHQPIWVNHHPKRFRFY